LKALTNLPTNKTEYPVLLRKLSRAAEAVWRQRAPKSLHHRLQREAEREGVSFNTLVIGMLSEGLGRKHADKNRRSALIHD